MPVTEQNETIPGASASCRNATKGNFFFFWTRTLWLVLVRANLLSIVNGGQPSVLSYAGPFYIIHSIYPPPGALFLYSSSSFSCWAPAGLISLPSAVQSRCPLIINEEGPSIDIRKDIEQKEERDRVQKEKKEREREGEREILISIPFQGVILLDLADGRARSINEDARRDWDWSRRTGSHSSSEPARPVCLQRERVPYRVRYKQERLFFFSFLLFGQGI